MKEVCENCGDLRDIVVLAAAAAVVGAVFRRIAAVDGGGSELCDNSTTDSTRTMGARLPERRA